MLVALTREQREAIYRFASLELNETRDIDHFAGKGDLAAAETAALRYLALVRLLRRMESTVDDECVELSIEDLATLGQYLLDRADDGLAFYGRWMRGEAPDWLGPFDSAHEAGLNEHLETRSTGVAILEAMGTEGGE